MKKYWPLVVLALVAVGIYAAYNGGCGKKSSGSSPTAVGGEVGEKSDTGTPVDEQGVTESPVPKKRMAKVSTKLIKRWMLGLNLRHPGMDARKGPVPGPGAIGLKTTKTTSTWTEMADVDSNGTEEKVGFLWDDVEKVMYAYTHDPVRLDDGTMARKGIVMAQFAEGNMANRQVGSGFWAYATTRDTTSFRVVEGSLYGCRFDHYGRTTECGPGRWTSDKNVFAIGTRAK